MSNETGWDGVAVAEYISEWMDERGLSDKVVALAIGYGSPNIVRMFREGRVKVPLDKIPDIADAIGANRASLMNLALSEYMPGTIRALMLCHSGLSDNELALIGYVRQVSENRDPNVIDNADVRDLIRDCFGVEETEERE